MVVNIQSVLRERHYKRGSIRLFRKHEINQPRLAKQGRVQRERFPSEAMKVTSTTERQKGTARKDTTMKKDYSYSSIPIPQGRVQRERFPSEALKVTSTTERQKDAAGKVTTMKKDYSYASISIPSRKFEYVLDIPSEKIGK
jgi:hypothetical protein